jgi:cell division protein FtsL
VAVTLSRKTWGISLLTRQKVERHSRQQRRRFSRSLFLLGFGLVCLALLHVWVRLQVVHLGYVLSATRKLQSHLEQENRELKLELATLTSRERLQTMAKSRLNLKEPDKNQVVILP